MLLQGIDGVRTALAHFVRSFLLPLLRHSTLPPYHVPPADLPPALPRSHYYPSVFHALHPQIAVQSAWSRTTTGKKTSVSTRSDRHHSSWPAGLSTCRTIMLRRPQSCNNLASMLSIMPLVLTALFLLFAALTIATPPTTLLNYSPEDLARVWQEEQQLLHERSTPTIEEEFLQSRAPADALLLTRQWSSGAEDAAQAGCATPAKGWAVNFELGEPGQSVEGILSTTVATLLTPGFKTDHAPYRPWHSHSSHPLTSAVAALGAHRAVQLGLDLGIDLTDSKKGSARARKRAGDKEEATGVDLYRDKLALGGFEAEDVLLAIPRSMNPCNTGQGPNGILGLGIPLPHHSRHSSPGASPLSALSEANDGFVFTPVLHPTHGHLILGRPPRGLTNTFWSPSASPAHWSLNGSLNDVAHFASLVLDLNEEEGLVGPAAEVRKLFASLGLQASRDPASGLLVAELEDCENGPRIELYLGTNGVVLEGWLSVFRQKKRGGSGACHLLVKGEDEEEQRRQGKPAWRVGWRFNTRFTVSYKYPQGAQNGEEMPLIGISLPPGVKGRHHTM